jgi:undecaprenyl-diphosphatase
LDARLYLLLYGGDTATWLTRVMIALTWLGSGWAILGLLPLVARHRTRRFALALGGALLAQSAVVWVVKQLVQRPRPFLSLGTHPTIPTPTDFSFPSGHASGTFTVAGFVLALCLAMPELRARWAIVAALVVVSMGIALSRVYLGVHYPGDIAGGALLGFAIGYAAGRWHTASHRKRAA